MYWFQWYYPIGKRVRLSGCGNQHHTYNTKSSIRVWASTPYLQHKEFHQGVGVNTILTTQRFPSGCGSQPHTYNTKSSIRVWESMLHMRHKQHFKTLSGCGNQYFTHNRENTLILHQGVGHLELCKVCQLIGTKVGMLYKILCWVDKD